MVICNKNISIKDPIREKIFKSLFMLEKSLLSSVGVALC